MSKDRRLVIIDDQLFKVCEGQEANNKIIEKLGERHYKIVVEDEQLQELLGDLQFSEKIGKYPPLHYILQHAAKGNFYGLKEILILDLDENISKIPFFFETKTYKDEPVTNSAILLDIYHERDQFPTGLDIAESLDQSPFTDRIAWLSVTGTLSSDYKPYPLIRKREIPPTDKHQRKNEHRDTIFLWWAWLFGDFKLEDSNGSKLSPREIVNNLREEVLVTMDNIEEVQEGFYLKSGKSARKGGLAGNLLEPVIWRKHEGDKKGEIVNALLKVSGKNEALNSEIEFIQSMKEEMKFPELLHPCIINEGQTHTYYCMEKIIAENFSEFIFEKIGFSRTCSRLKEICKKISDWQKLSWETNNYTEININEGIIISHVRNIKSRILQWIDHNTFYEPLIYPKKLIINNMQYFNAIYLCDRIVQAKDSLKSLEPKYTIEIHGDIVAQNIFIDDNEIRLIDPRGKTDDYLTDYIKLFSSFSGQGHIEYLAKKPDSKCAHFYVNEGINPDACYYVCSPSLDDPVGIKSCQQEIVQHLEEEKRDVNSIYNKIEEDKDKWRYRFLLGLARQYLGAPPYRDSARFHDEMKFLYYRGVEILNEFCERTKLIESRKRIFE